MELACAYTSRVHEPDAQSVVMITSRRPHDALYIELADRIEIMRIRDCDAPGMIDSSAYAGRRYTRELEAGPAPDVVPSA